MNTLLAKLPPILAFLVGGMSIFAGGMVLRGWNIIAWLPVYHFVVGLLTLIPAYMIWVNHPYALSTSVVIFSLHALVLVVCRI